MERWAKITKSGDGYILLAGKGDYPGHTMRGKSLQEIFKKVERIFEEENKRGKL